MRRAGAQAVDDEIGTPSGYSLDVGCLDKAAIQSAKSATAAIGTDDSLTETLIANLDRDFADFRTSRSVVWQILQLHRFPVASLRRPLHVGVSCHGVGQTRRHLQVGADRLRLERNDHLSFTADKSWVRRDAVSGGHFQSG